MFTGILPAMAPAMVRFMLRDDGESVELMEPMLPLDGHPRQDDLEDLTVEFVQKASALAGRLPPIVRDGVGALVRSMNCYYSNLIEGHDTHPVDIERALICCWRPQGDSNPRYRRERAMS